MGRKFKDYLRQYSLDDIFDADEAVLYWKLLPHKTLTFKGDDCAGGEKRKDQVSVLLAGNMTGTERCRLLVIGKAGNPSVLRA